LGLAASASSPAAALRDRWWFPELQIDSYFVDFEGTWKVD